MQLEQLVLPPQIKPLQSANISEITGYFTVINEEQLVLFSDSNYIQEKFQNCNFIEADDIHIEYVSTIKKILSSSSKKYQDTLQNPKYFETNEKKGFRHNNDTEDEIATFLVSTEGYDVASIFKYCFLNGLIKDNQDEYNLTQKGKLIESQKDHQILNDYLLYQIRNHLNSDNILINYSILLLATLSKNEVRSTNLDDIILTAIKLAKQPITKFHITEALKSLKEIIILIYPSINIDPQPGEYLIIGNEFNNLIENNYPSGLLIDLTFEDSYLIEDLLES